MNQSLGDTQNKNNQNRGKINAPYHRDQIIKRFHDRLGDIIDKFNNGLIAVMSDPGKQYLDDNQPY
jgi:hypothetical protein